ncbi:hypothetical protein TcWFU_000702 [Taenia crassiceps]|uniref:Uncharacterized protein n=1 Tax=Taenia crassiceps TaxID=6207 RepID=A0ABR4Q4A1_9CEST
MHVRDLNPPQQKVNGTFNRGYHALIAACVTYGFLIVFITIVCIVVKGVSRRRDRKSGVKWASYTQFQPQVLEEAQEFTAKTMHYHYDCD